MPALPKGASVTDCKGSVTIHVSVNPALMSVSAKRKRRSYEEQARETAVKGQANRRLYEF